MRFRKLRIAWSVFWAVAGVLLVALWVRSYHWQDFISVRAFIVRSYDWRIGFFYSSGYSQIPWTHFSYRPGGEVLGWIWGSPWGIGKSIAGEWYVFVPYSFAAFLTVVLSTVPWLQWRFSLRTLLFATTLIAVVLGIAMYVGGK